MKPLTTDPGSLDRLHDLVAPPPVSWWPPAPGWYVLFILGSVCLALVVWALRQRWLHNRYRRAGLAELAQLEAASNSPETLSAVAILIKRVALAAFPREQVASLTGPEWLNFLDTSAATTGFTQGPGRSLDQCYEPVAPRATPELFAVVRHWIKHHRADWPC